MTNHPIVLAHAQALLTGDAVDTELKSGHAGVARKG
jgi:hypothetical protein